VQNIIFCAAYYTILNSNCEAQRVSKNLNKIVEDRVKSQNLCNGDLSGFFLLFKEKVKVTKNQTTES
jgi:hypothetical protein